MAYITDLRLEVVYYLDSLKGDLDFYILGQSNIPLVPGFGILNYGRFSLPEDNTGWVLKDDLGDPISREALYLNYHRPVRIASYSTEKKYNLLDNKKIKKIKKLIEFK